MRLNSRAVGHHLAAIALYLGLAILMTWPVAARLDGSMAGYPADNRQGVWTLWVFGQEVLQDGDALHTSYIYYPEGISLALHTLATPKAALGLALGAVTSVVEAFNWLIILSLALSGYTCWLLVRDLTADSCAALVGGCAFGFCPFLLAHATAGHLNLVSAEGIPLFALFFLRAFKTKRWTDSIWAGLAMAYTGLCEWAYLLFLAVLCAIYAAYQVAVDRSAHLRWPVLRQYALIGIVTGAVCAPLLVPAIIASRSGAYDIRRYVGGTALYVSDLLGFLTPSPAHFLVGRLVHPVTDRFTGGAAEGTVFVGMSVLALAALGWRRARGRQRAFWLAVVVVFAVLSLGPGLHMLGRYQFPGLAFLHMGTIAQRLGVPMRPEWIRMFDEAPMIPLPGALLQLLPVFRWTRAPSRFVIIVMLALAVLAGHGAARVRERLQSRRLFGVAGAPLAVAGLAVLVFLEFSIAPFPTTPATIPRFYRELAEEEGDFAILELPIRPYELWPQYWQSFHGKRLMYGHISRVPEERFQYLKKLEDEVVRPTGFFERVDVRYLVLHETQLGDLDRDEAYALRDALSSHFALVLSEGELRVYCGHGECGHMETEQ